MGHQSQNLLLGGREDGQPAPICLFQSTAANSQCNTPTQQKAVHHLIEAFVLDNYFESTSGLKHNTMITSPVMELFLYKNIIYTGNQSHSPTLCVSNYLEQHPNIVIFRCRPYVTGLLIDFGMKINYQPWSSQLRQNSNSALYDVTVHAFLSALYL